MGRLADNMDFEIAFFEGILKDKPDFVQALMAVGDLYTKKGLYEKGLSVDRRLSILRPDDPYVLYNLACSYSLLQHVEQAYHAMKLAVDCGYDDLEHLERDADLVNLRADERFQRFLSDVKKQNLPL